MNDNTATNSEATDIETPKKEPKRGRPRKTNANAQEQSLGDRIADYLTFRNAPSEAQGEAFAWVNGVFMGFSRKVFNTLEESTIRVRLTNTDEFIMYKFARREAERWANAAIARDWNEDFVFDRNIAIREYPVDIAENAPEAEKVCHALGRIVFTSATLLADTLPEGRCMENFVTSIEVMRGWLMDCVNEHADNHERRNPKTLFNTKNRRITP